MTIAPNLRPAYAALQHAYVKSIHHGDVDVLERGLTLEREVADPLVVVLGFDAATLTGRIVDTQKRPVAGATVVAIPESSLKFRVEHRFAYSDGSGQFQLQGIPPGSYKIFAWEDVDHGLWQDEAFVRDYTAAAATMQFAAGETRNAEVIASPRR